MKTYRHEAVSGTFYKSSENELRTQIKKLFLHPEFGPSNEPRVKKTDEFKAYIVPHAGYEFSGYAAAHTYKKIAENTNPEIIVILGPNHQGFELNASVFPEGYWMTPLGKLEVDEEFNKLLLKDKLFVPDEISHSYEHSIEVQAPFIKYIYGEESPKIVPILINTPYNNLKLIKELGDSLFKAWMKSGKRILFIASSDLSHVGRGYGFIPFEERGEELSKKVKRLDEELIKLLINLKIDEAAKFAEEKKLTICGLSAILVLLVVLKNMKGKKIKGEILKHYTSADVTKNYNNFVDYASIEYKEK